MASELASAPSMLDLSAQAELEEKAAAEAAAAAAADAAAAAMACVHFCHGAVAAATARAASACAQGACALADRLIVLWLPPQVHIGPAVVARMVDIRE